MTALIRSLPKPLRRNFVPAPDHARAVPRTARHRAGPLLDALEDELRRMSGVVIRRQDWELDQVPTTCGSPSGSWTTTGSVVAEGKDLAALKRELAPQGTRGRSPRRHPASSRPACTTWDFGDAAARRSSSSVGEPRREGVPGAGRRGRRRSPSGSSRPRRPAAAAMWAGTRRLLLLTASTRR